MLNDVLVRFGKPSESDLLQRTRLHVRPAYFVHLILRVEHQVVLEKRHVLFVSLKSGNTKKGLGHACKLLFWGQQSNRSPFSFLFFFNNGSRRERRGMLCVLRSGQASFQDVQLQHTCAQQLFPTFVVHANPQ